MLSHLYLVHFHEFDGMEQSVVDARSFERYLAISDQVNKRTAFEHRRTLARRFRAFVCALHQLVYTFAFERGYLDDGHSYLMFQLCRVDLVSRLMHLVYHIERHYDGHVYLKQLSGQIEVSLQIGRVHDVYHAIGFFIENVIARNDLLGRVRRKRIYARQIDYGYLFSEFFIDTFAFVDRDARPVAYVRGRACQIVEQRRLAAIGIACQRKSLHSFTSVTTSSASLLRKVSS